MHSNRTGKITSLAVSPTCSMNNLYLSLWVTKLAMAETIIPLSFSPVLDISEHKSYKLKEKKYN
jgi:hypothetical protein